MNLKRISYLLIAYFIENKKILLLCCFLVFAAGVLGSASNNLTVFAIALVCFIPCWIAGTFFKSSLKKNNSAHFFNLPVTTAEKLCNAIVVVFAFGAIIFTLHFLGNCIGRYGLCPFLDIANELRVSSFFILDGLSSFLYYAVILVVFLFGSIYFKKNAFWKTLACGIAFFIVLSLYADTLIYFANIKLFAPTEAMFKWRNLSFFDQSYILPIAVIVLFGSLIYLRLKETEV